MILEDEKLVRLSLDKTLDHDGYTVDTSATAIKTIEVTDKVKYAPDPC